LNNVRVSCPRTCATARPQLAKADTAAPSATRQVIRDATNKINFAGIYMATAALIGGVITKFFTGENPKEINDYIFPHVGGANPDGSPRRFTTMFYLREIPMFMKHAQEHGGGIGGVLAGGKDMLLSKMLFKPFMNFGQSKLFRQRDLGHQCPKLQAGPAGVTAHRESAAVAPGARPYQDEANTRDWWQRNNLLLAQQSGDSDKIEAAVSAMLAAGYKAPYIESTLQGEQGDQRMFKQLPQTDQMSLLNQATPAEFDRYFPRYAKKETIRQCTGNIRRQRQRNE
jgi:hypothetical protein